MHIVDLRLLTDRLATLRAFYAGALDFAEYLAANGIPALGATGEIGHGAVVALILYNTALIVIGVVLLRRLRRSEAAPDAAPGGAVAASLAAN